MIIHELTPRECRDLLARTTFGRLACAQSDQPYITPIFFYFDRAEDCLYSFSSLGQKVEWMRQNPKVCVQVDEIADESHWTTLVVFGRYDEITATEPDSEVRRRALDLFQQRPTWWLPGAGKLASGEEHGTSVIYRVRIAQVTGRRAARPIR